MPARNSDLHGSAPDKSDVALLLIDVINDLDFPEANQLLRYARPMARKLLLLKQRAKKAGIPVIYVNDNFGRWQSDFRRQVQHCLRAESRGRELVSWLRPEEDDYFVLNPKHSGFFSTTLETLLRYLGSTKLILTGIAGNFCVLFTANDAYMRDYDLSEKHHLVIDPGYGRIKGQTFRLSNMGDETEETVAHLLRCLDDCLAK